MVFGQFADDNCKERLFLILCLTSHHHPTKISIERSVLIFIEVIDAEEKHSQRQETNYRGGD